MSKQIHYPFPVLLNIYVFIPVNINNHLILSNRRQALLFHNHKEAHAYNHKKKKRDYHCVPVIKEEIETPFIFTLKVFERDFFHHSGKSTITGVSVHLPEENGKQHYRDSKGDKESY